MNTLIPMLNETGARFVAHAGAMLVQAGGLIILLFIADRLLRRHLRASLRYGLWMLVLVKLVLSPQFSLPTGIGTWAGGVADFQSARIDSVPRVEGVSPSRVEGVPPSLEDKPASVRGQDARGTRGQDGRDTASAPVRLQWPGAILALWLAGVLVLGTALLMRAVSVRRIVHRAELPSESLCDLLARCRRDVGLARSVELKLTRDLSGPALCRAWRPVILMPKALTDSLPEDKQRAILTHELCHIKRADPWVNLAQTLLQVFYFYNPLVWLANRSIRRVREQAVDERVLVCLRGQLQCYSHTLIDIASAMRLRPGLGLGLIGVAESKTRLNERIQLMLHRPTPKNAGLGYAGAITLLVLGCTLLPMAARGGAGNPGGGAVGAALAVAEGQAAEKLLSEIRTTADKMAAAFNAKQLDALMTFYVPDILSLPPGEPALVGAEALQKTYPPVLNAGLQLRSFKLPLNKVVVCGDLIYMGGIYSLTLGAPDGSNASTDTRCGLIIAQRQKDGSLKLKLEAFNRPSDTDQSADGNASQVFRCAPESPTLPANAKLYDQIRNLDERVEKMFIDKKVAEALDQYTEDAVLMANGGQIFQGKTTLGPLFQQSSEQSPLQDIQMKFARVEGNEQMVYVVKWCGWKLKNPVSGMDYTIPGKSLHVWQRQADGSWKIAFDLNNMDLVL